MARGRVLAAIAIIACALIVYVCNRPARGVSISGVFLDDLTGEPIEGVRLFVEYQYITKPWQAFPFPREVLLLGYAEGVTDVHGGFEIAGPRIKGITGGRVPAVPVWVHKKYGWGSFRTPTRMQPNPSDLVIRIRRTSDELEHFTDPKARWEHGPCGLLQRTVTSCRRYVYGKAWLD